MNNKLYILFPVIIYTLMMNGCGLPIAAKDEMAIEREEIAESMIGKNQCDVIEKFGDPYYIYTDSVNKYFIYSNKTSHGEIIFITLIPMFYMPSAAIDEWGNDNFSPARHCILFTLNKYNVVTKVDDGAFVPRPIAKEWCEEIFFTDTQLNNFDEIDEKSVSKSCPTEISKATNY